MRRQQIDTVKDAAPENVSIHIKATFPHVWFKNFPEHLTSGRGSKKNKKRKRSKTTQRELNIIQAQQNMFGGYYKVRPEHGCRLLLGENRICWSGGLYFKFFSS